jgi:hypothetical protein
MIRKGNYANQFDKELLSKREMINNKEENRNIHFRNIQNLDLRNLEKDLVVEAGASSKRKTKRKSTDDRIHLKVADDQDLALLARNTDTDVILCILINILKY